MFMIAPYARVCQMKFKQREKCRHTNGDVRPADTLLTRLFLNGHAD
jgi:hypothetical protein